MNAGVSTAPCAVVMTPRRARPSLCVTRNAKSLTTSVYGKIWFRVFVVSWQILTREENPRRRDLRRPLGRARSVARVGGRGLQEPRPRPLRSGADSHLESRPLEFAE